MILDIPFVVVDVETTGSCPFPDRVIEIGATKVLNGKIVDNFSTLVNPGRNIPPIITWLTGITNKDVATAPSFIEVAEDFKNFLGDAVFVAHNVHFDYRFMSSELVMAEYGPLKNPMLCTIKLARRTFPGLMYYNLVDLCRNLKIPLVKAHRADHDAQAAAHILIKSLKKLTACGFDEIEEFGKFYRNSPAQCARMLQLT